jgi:hypothetical protein
MFQQIIALLVIAFFLSRLGWQKKKGNIRNNEFLFWLVFWIAAAGAVLAIKQIDELLSAVGFSGRGIDVLFYLAVILLFYLVFKVRLRIENVERNLTKISREIAISKKEDNK